MQRKLFIYWLLVINFCFLFLMGCNGNTEDIFTLEPVPTRDEVIESFQLVENIEIKELETEAEFIHPVPSGKCGTLYSSEHRATDVASDNAGQPIKASWSGRVVKSWQDPETIADPDKGLGYLLVIEYRYEDITPDQRPASLKDRESLYIRYAHLDPSGLVAENTAVSPNQIIGKVGDTGYSFGPHIHLQVKTSPSGSYTSFDSLNQYLNPQDVFPGICE